MTEVALDTGGRIGELLALRWQDIDLEGRRVHFRHALNKSAKAEDREIGDGSKRPKALGPLKWKGQGEERVISIPAETAQLLRLLKARSPYSQPYHPVFASQDGGFRNYGGVQRAFAWVRDRAGLAAANGKRAVTLHSCRHTYASNLLHDGESPARVAVLIGDTLQTVIGRYLHPLQGEEHDAATIARLAARRAARG